MDERLKSLARILRRNEEVLVHIRNYGMNADELRAEMTRRLKRNVLMERTIDPDRFSLTVEVPFAKRKKAVPNGI